MKQQVGWKEDGQVGAVRKRSEKQNNYRDFAG